MASDNELLIKLGVESSSASKQIKEITKELKTLDKQMDSVDKSTDGFNKSIGSIEKQTGLFENKLDLLNTQLNLYRKRLDETSEQLEKAKKKMEDMGDRTKENGDEWDKANKKLEVAQTRYNNIVRNMKETEAQIQSTTQEIKKLNDSVEDLKFDKFSQEIEDIDKDLKSLDKQIESFDSTTAGFGKTMLNSANQLGLYGEKVDLLNTSIEKHKKELKSTEVNIKIVQSSLDELGRRTAENADEWDNATDELEKYQSRHKDLERSLNDVQSELRETVTDMKDLSRTMAETPFESLSGLLSTVGDGFSKIGDITQPLSTAVAGFGGISVKTAMDFEDAMAKVQATSGVTSDELVILEQKAREIGSTTQLSATQGAEALLLLAQAGYDTEQSMLMVDDIVALAIANEMDLATATEIVTASMNAYGWELERTGELTDILSAVSRASSTDVGEIGNAFRTVAPTANALGFEVDDVAMVLGLMANNAIHGAEAGNGLKSILSSLVKPTKNGAKALKELGVEVADSKGNMKDLDEIVVDLQDAFAGLSEEEQAQIATTLVGKMQMSKFLAIVNSGGDDVDKLSGAIGNCTGLTEEMKNTMEDTAGGVWREFQSTMEETAIIIGDALLPHIIDILEVIGDLAKKFASLDEETQSSYIQFGLFLAILSPLSKGLGGLFNGLSSVVGVMGKISGSFASATTGIGTLSSTVSTAGGVLGATGTGSFIGGLASMAGAVAPWLIGGTLVVGTVAGIWYLIDNYDELKKKVHEVEEEWSLSNELTEEANKLLAESVEKDYKAIEGSMDDFEKEGVQKLITSMNTLNEDGSQDFTGFLDHLKTGMETSKTKVAEHAGEMSEALGFLNTDIATVFSAEDLAKIQETWSGQMTQGLEGAYTNMENLLNNKDEIILGIMEEHGVDYDEAYDTWEGWVLDGYEDFLTEMIEAQTGYQEDSLGSLRTFLMEQGLETTKDFEAGTKEIEEAYGRRGDMLYLEYQEMLEATARGESAINGIQFDSAEQARLYGDMVYEYKSAQLAKEKEEELQMLYGLAYEKGLINEQEYTDLVANSERRQGAYQTEIDALTTLIENGANDVSGSWDEVWNTIALAEKNGIDASLIRNEDFINSVTEYFNNGGTDMSEAIQTAMENVVGSFEEGTQLSVSELEYLYTHGSESLGQIINEMGKTGLSFDETCETLNLDANAMKGYLLALADDGTVSMEELQEMFDDTGDSAGDMGNDVEDGTDDAQDGIDALSGADLKPTQDELDETGQSALDMGDDVDSGTTDAQDGMNGLDTSSLYDVQRDFSDTGSDALDMAIDVTEGCTDAQGAIDGVEGKEENVVVNFLSSGFTTVMGRIASFVSSVIGAKNAGKSDSFIEPINFGESYTEDLYGLKDAGIRTISLAHLEDGISAYATKDSTASDAVIQSVYNYNASTTHVSQSPSSFDKKMAQQFTEALQNTNNNSGDVYVNIEVKNGNPQEIIKILDNYLKPRSKKW